MKDLNSSPDGESQRCAVSTASQEPALKCAVQTRSVSAGAVGAADVLWLQVSFSARFDAAGVERWRKRLHSFLSRCGLVAAISPERVAIFPVGKPITSFDRGLVIGWLTAQPEVVFVHIDRCTDPARRTVMRTQLRAD